jgi:hypothetical protein
MNYTPRLQNLLKMRRSLLALSEAVSNLTDEDVDNIETAYQIPGITRLNNFSDYIADIVRNRILMDHQAAFPADEPMLFCPKCQMDTTHRRFVANGESRYKCNQCGLVGGKL